MCIIIHKPAKVKLDPIIYKNCFARNEDGAGISFVQDDKLVIEKGIMKADDFLKRVLELEELELVIHCRKMSKGAVSEANCHPFPAKSELFPEYEFAVVHNGTLTWRSTVDKSDTAHFVEDVIAPIVNRDPFFFEYPINRAMMAAYISFSNKFCIMRWNSKDKEVEVFFVNKQEGVEYGQCWFSNLSFTDETSRYPVDADRKRIHKWTPKLYWEPTPTTAYTNYHKGMYTGAEDDMFSRDGYQTDKEDWVFAKGYGWYNKNPKYDGFRSLADYEKATGKKPKSPEDAKVDALDYLSKDEIKAVRKPCQEIVKECHPDFNFKNCSTIDLASFARVELRAMIPELKNMTNEALMNHILYGEVETKKA